MFAPIALSGAMVSQAHVASALHGRLSNRELRA
jgi:hypothetical protein